ncbi:MAG: hypothetical protein GX122_06170 [Candidatus Cloacimonetes bacterium]|nr:hypothetical protein [Candidatus Cloacimonadota bacterium]
MKSRWLKFLLICVFACVAGALAAKLEQALTPTISHRRGALGIGYGLCYGGLGFNGDFNFTDDIVVSGSIGTFGYVSVFELGMKYYFREFDDKLRPTASLWYGVNSMVVARPSASSGLNPVTEAHTGFCVGAGAEWMFSKNQKHGLDGTLLFILNTTQKKRIEELEAMGHSKFSRGERLLFSFGYRYAF